MRSPAHSRYHTAAQLVGQGGGTLDARAKAVLTKAVQAQLGFLDKWALEIQDNAAYMLGQRARAVVRTGHRRELLAQCDEDAAAAGDAARRHEPVPSATAAAVGRSPSWRATATTIAPGCSAKRELPDVCAASRRPGAAADQGRTVGVMPSMQVIVPKISSSTRRSWRAVANGLDGAGQGRDSGLSDDHRHLGSPGRF